MLSLFIKTSNTNFISMNQLHKNHREKQIPDDKKGSRRHLV